MIEHDEQRMTMTTTTTATRTMTSAIISAQCQESVRRSELAVRLVHRRRELQHADHPGPAEFRGAGPAPATDPGDPAFDPRWDLLPGPQFGTAISIQDLTSLIAGPTAYPPMFNGQRAFGKTCKP